MRLSLVWVRIPRPPFGWAAVVHASVLVLALAGFCKLWDAKVSAALALADRSLADARLSVSATVKAASDHVAMLQTTAELGLAARAPPLFDSTGFVAAPDGQGFANSNADAHAAPWIALGGDLPASGSARASELAVAASLAPLFARVRTDISDAAWVYYVSKARFTVAMPFERNVLQWTDTLLQTEMFRGATPEHDPSRGVFWSAVYLDAGGGGQMCSVVLPVAGPGGGFRGIVGIDFTLHELDAIIRSAGLQFGTAFVVNQSGQVLASSHAEAGDRQHEIGDLLAPALASRTHELLDAAPDRYQSHGGWLVSTTGLAPSPWKLLFVVDRWHVRLLVLRQMDVEALGLALVFGMMALFERNRRTSCSLKKFSAAVENSSASIMITDRTGVIEYVNRSFTTITGFLTHEAIGRTPSLLKSGVMESEIYVALWDTILSGRSWTGELLNKRRDGSLYWEGTQISPIFNTGGKIISFVSIKDDITEKRRIQEELSFLSTTDTLTKIANRRRFMEALEAQVAGMGRDGGHPSLLIIDVDHFKRVNDRFGHGTGDRALIAVAAACLKIVRQSDLAARLGGEEFAVLLPACGQDEAYDVAECIRETIAAAPLQAEDGTPFSVTVSIGVATAGADDTAEALLARADGALYRSKRSGRNRATVAPRRDAGSVAAVL